MPGPQPAPKVDLRQTQRLLRPQLGPVIPDGCPLAPESPEAATTAVSLQRWGFHSRSGLTKGALGRQAFSVCGSERSYEVRPGQRQNDIQAQTTGPGINICSQANLLRIIRNFTISGEQDSFTQSV